MPPAGLARSCRICASRSSRRPPGKRPHNRVDGGASSTAAAAATRRDRRATRPLVKQRTPGRDEALVPGGQRARIAILLLATMGAADAADPPAVQARGRRPGGAYPERELTISGWPAPSDRLGVGRPDEAQLNEGVDQRPVMPLGRHLADRKS